MLVELEPAFCRVVVAYKILKNSQIKRTIPVIYTAVISATAFYQYSQKEFTQMFFDTKL